MENEPGKKITLSYEKKHSRRLFTVFGLLGGLAAVSVFPVSRELELTQAWPEFTVAQPWVALFGGLLFIALLIGYLGMKTRQTAHLEQLTNELAVSNKQLLLENAERKESEQRIRTMAYYDCLTGLPNRVFYQEMLGRALAWAHRHKKTVAVLFIDLDNFKRVNDTFGHDVGDLLLRAVAEIITRCVRKSDYVARSEDTNVTDMVSRLGGDEFLVLLSEVAQGQDAARVARRILGELGSPLRLAGHEVLISASIGIALFPLDATDAESLLKHADVAMYHAKSNGRKNYQFYGECMNEAAVQRLQLEHALQKAVERGEFVLHFQPILNVAHRAVVGIEALVRWQHPVRGILPPTEFIKLAEETGLIVRIGEWVLRAACALNQAWQNTGTGPLKVAVNLSVRQFDQQDLLETIKQVLKDSGLAPQYLELEITESAILKDPEKATKKLLQLRELGVGVSLDDFGTGYSSLSHLRRFSLQALKIDRSSVMHITSNEDDAAIVAAIIRMAHSLRLRVVAEGVETNEQLAVLRVLGCDEAQGFLFSHPLSTDDCSSFLLKQKNL